MKKILPFIFCLLSLVFVGCPHEPNNTSENQGSQTTPENPNSQGTNTYVNFKNNSSYNVNVYYPTSPYTNNTIYASIPAGQEVRKEFSGNTDNYASTFFFVYDMTIGGSDASFPYFPENDVQNHKSLKLESGKQNDIIIDEITECKTKSAYLFLENNTTSDIYLFLISGAVVPYKKSSKFIKPTETGVFEIGTEGNVQLESIEKATIIMDSIEYDLPSITYEPGKIYTVTVTNNNENGAKEKIKASLKAISPFNIDTSKKMWNFSDSSFLYDWSNGITPVIKNAYSKEKGTIMMGTMKNNPKNVGMTRINQYGEYSSILEFTSKANDVNYLTVVDFVEQSDGSIVMLLSCKTDDDFIDMLVAYDFGDNTNSGTELWRYVFPDSMLFRVDSANKLILLQDNNVAVVGAVMDASEGSNKYDLFAPYIGMFDYTKKSEDGLSNIRNEEGCKTYLVEGNFKNESQFCSAYYDGTNIYACGFTNFDENYNSASPHNGIIYKFNKDLSSPTVFYQKERCLFFTLSGNGSKWYTCGEYWKIEDGKLFGCYISSSMIAHNPEVYPSFYSGAKQYSWFNQLCTYDNMVVMCGQTSDDKNGTTNPLPFVVAYDAQGNMLWENLSYKKWATALNIIPNTIGTYILQLTDKNNKQIHFVSADFLGNEVID